MVDLHREAQAALAHGETPFAISVQVDLHRTLCREDLDPFDEEGYEIALDVLHAAAFEDASTRPARLIIEGCGGSPLE